MARNVLYLRINAAPNKKPNMYRVLRKFGFDIPYRERGVETVTLKVGDTIVEAMASSLSAEGIEYLKQHRMEFDERDLERAEFLHLVVNASCGDSHDYDGLYDSSTGCPKCGSGRRQVGNLRLNKLKMGSKSMAVTWTREAILNERLHTDLSRSGLTGITVRPVDHYTTWKSSRPEPKLFQLVPSTVLPSMGPQTVFERDASRLSCDVCGSGLTWRDDTQFVYSGEIRGIASDFSWTKEEFGWGLKKPELVISKRAYQLFQHSKVKHVEFRPLSILDFADR